jgi:hypothetical protein
MDFSVVGAGVETMVDQKKTRAKQQHKKQQR